MKLSPHSRATRTLPSASSSVTLRNSAPSELAPKLRMGRSRSVWPSRRVCMEEESGNVSQYRFDRERACSRPNSVRKRTACRSQTWQIGILQNSLIRPTPHGQQHIRPQSLVGGLNCQHVVGALDVFVEIPLQN